MSNKGLPRHQFSRREMLRTVGLGSVAVAGASFAAPLATSAKLLEGASGTLTIGIDEQAAIKAVIDQYFRGRYEGQRLLVQQDFSRFTDGSLRAKQFVQKEWDKREVELLQAQLFGLNYQTYNYTLDFSRVEVDQEVKRAFATVLDGHDVVFADHAPIVSKQRNVAHAIELRHDGIEWRIVEDDYVDDIRRMIDGGGGKDAAIDRLRAVKQNGVQPVESVPVPNDREPKPDKPLPVSGQVDTTRRGKLSPFSIQSGTPYGYNRYAAWNYAWNWYSGRNSTYNNYGGGGGNDCTNFVSQCIQASGAPLDWSGSYVWYYQKGASDSYSWVNVNGIWDYLTGNTWTGPYGVAAWTDSVEVGDLVQLDFGSGFQHCPIITTKGGTSFNLIYVAAHSTDQFDYPISNYSLAVGHRFCKIWGYYD